LRAGVDEQCDGYVTAVVLNESSVHSPILLHFAPAEMLLCSTAVLLSAAAFHGQLTSSLGRRSHVIAQQAGSEQRHQEVATLIRKNRPLGRKQLGAGTFNWLQREMRWLAQDFALLVEQESLGYVSDTEEEAIVEAARSRFAVARLQARIAT
jgi:hypothetical protein